MRRSNDARDGGQAQIAAGKQFPCAQKQAAAAHSAMDGESDEYMFRDSPPHTMDAKTAYAQGPVQSGPRKRALAAEHKKIPEDFAFSAIKEKVLKENLKNIPVVIKVAEKIFRRYSTGGAQITKQAAIEAAAGVCYYCEPDNPTGGKLRQRGAYCNFQQARAATASPQEGAPSSST